MINQYKTLITFCITIHNQILYSFGGDFDEVLGRLRREQTVRKFVYKFLDDKSFDLFEAAMRDRDYGEALRAVHTLKGICQNLSFGRLYASSSLMTKALKENDYSNLLNPYLYYLSF